MEQLEINKQINRIQQILIESGMDVAKVVEGLKELRAMFSASKQPRMTRLSRMAMEHVEENETFLIEMPADEPDEEDEIVEEVQTEELSDEQKQIESLDYMLSLMTKPDNKLNAVELTAYYDALIENDR